MHRDLSYDRTAEDMTSNMSAVISCRLGSCMIAANFYWTMRSLIGSRYAVINNKSVDETESIYSGVRVFRCLCFNWFHDKREWPKLGTYGTSQIWTGEGIGTVVLPTHPVSVRLCDVLYVPSLCHSLLSWNQLKHKWRCPCAQRFHPLNSTIWLLKTASHSHNSRSGYTAFRRMWTVV